MPWLLKSEPDVYSIDNLKKDKIEFWDGVRNYQARNFLRSMQLKQLAFFYHSNCKVPGIYGLMRVCSTPYPDQTAFDENSKYFCSKSSPDNPKWFGVDFEFVHKWDEPLSLQSIKNSHLDFPLTRKGNRLSVMELSEEEFQELLHMINALDANRDTKWST